MTQKIISDTFRFPLSFMSSSQASPSPSKIKINATTPDSNSASNSWEEFEAKQSLWSAKQQKRRRLRQAERVQDGGYSPSVLRNRNARGNIIAGLTRESEELEAKFAHHNSVASPSYAQAQSPSSPTTPPSSKLSSSFLLKILLLAMAATIWFSFKNSSIPPPPPPPPPQPEPTELLQNYLDSLYNLVAPSEEPPPI